MNMRLCVALVAMLAVSATVNASPVGPNCNAGQYSKQVNGGFVCTGCPNGYFSAGGAALSCTAHRQCVAGEKVSAAGTASADRTCAACEAGTFSTRKNAAACTAHRSCSAGDYVARAPSATNDRLCLNCYNGQYSDSVNAAQCSPHTACPQGQVETQKPTHTSNRQCGTAGGGSNNPPPTCGVIGSLGGNPTPFILQAGWSPGGIGNCAQECFSASGCLSVSYYDASETCTLYNQRISALSGFMASPYETDMFSDLGCFA